MKYLTNSGLSYFLNKIKAYLTSNTYLNSIGISNSEIDNIADDAGYSSGSLPASEDIFITGNIIPNTDNSVDLGASSKNIKMIYTKGITINGTQFLPSDYIPKTGSNQISGDLIPSTDGTVNLGSSSYQWNNAYIKSLTISNCIINTNEQQFIFNKEYSDATDNWLGIHTYLDKNHTRLGFHAIGDFSGNRGFRWFVRGQSTNSVETDIFGFGRKWNETSYMYINATLETDLIPAGNNSKSLGSSTNKWKSLNGIAPDELGLPTSAYTDVSSYITNFDSTPNTFTAPVSGLLFLDGTNSDPSVECVITNNTKVYKMNVAYAFGTTRGLFPVEKGDSIIVYINKPITAVAKIFHLKGKV